MATTEIAVLTKKQKKVMKKVETARMKREEAYVEEQVIAARRLCYMVLKTEQGALIVKAEGLRLKARRDQTNQSIRKLPKAERLEAKLRNTFDIYDVDGSNYIDCEEFKALLKDLCIPVSPEELEKEFSKMDSDHNGECSFDEFKKWHNDHGEGITKINRFARLKMKAQKRGVSGYGSLDQIRAKRALVANALKKAADDARFEFRNKNPPAMVKPTKGKKGKKGKEEGKDTSTNESLEDGAAAASVGIDQKNASGGQTATTGTPGDESSATGTSGGRGIVRVGSDLPSRPHPRFSTGVSAMRRNGSVKRMATAAGASGGKPRTNADGDLIAALQSTSIYADGMNATPGHLSNHAAGSAAEQSKQFEDIKASTAALAAGIVASDDAGAELEEGELTDQERRTLDHFEADLLFHEVELHIREDCWL